MSQTPSSEGPVGGASGEPVAAGGGSGNGSAQAPEIRAGSQLPATGPVVLDASFVIALLQRDPGATALAYVLPRGVMTSVTAGEVFTAIAEAGGPDPERVEGVLRALGVHIVDLPLAAARQFPKLRAMDAARRAEQEFRGDKGADLSLSDLSILGYALVADVPVIAGGRQWTTFQADDLTLAVYLWQPCRGESAV